MQVIVTGLPSTLELSFVFAVQGKPRDRAHVDLEWDSMFEHHRASFSLRAGSYEYSLTDGASPIDWLGQGCFRRKSKALTVRSGIRNDIVIPGLEVYGYRRVHVFGPDGEPSTGFRVGDWRGPVGIERPCASVDRETSSFLLLWIRDRGGVHPELELEIDALGCRTTLARVFDEPLTEDLSVGLSYGIPLVVHRGACPPELLAGRKAIVAVFAMTPSSEPGGPPGREWIRTRAESAGSVESGSEVAFGDDGRMTLLLPSPGTFELWGGFGTREEKIAPRPLQEVRVDEPIPGLPPQEVTLDWGAWER